MYTYVSRMKIFTFTINLISLVAENVVQKEHSLASQQVRVEEYNPKPKIINVSKDELCI